MVLTSFLSIVIPHYLLSFGVSFLSVGLNARKLYRLEESAYDQGLRIRKRDISRGVIIGVLIKASVTILLIGFDDFLLVGGLLGGALTSSGGIWSSTFDIIHSTVGTDDLLSAADDHYGRDLLGHIKRGFTAPVRWIESHYNIASAADVLHDMNAGNAVDAFGWNVSSDLLVKDVIVLGAAEAATKETIELSMAKVTEGRASRPSRRPWRWHSRFEEVST